MFLASGSGKTHLGLALSRNNGCIPIIFNRVHGALIPKAVKAINDLYPSPQVLAERTVLDIQAEERYLELAMRVVKLIPLTFLQFAGIFLQKGKLLQHLGGLT